MYIYIIYNTNFIYIYIYIYICGLIYAESSLLNLEIYSTKATVNLIMYILY